MVTNTNWCKCASVNEREREQQKRTKYALYCIYYIYYITQYASACCLPETACSIAQHLGGMNVELAVIMVIWGGVPVRVGYDDTIGQNGQGILDDWHLQCIT